MGSSGIFYGKSSYIREQLPDVAATFKLLDQGLLLSVLADPIRIRHEVEALDLWDCVVVIDEVHLMMEDRRIRFLLTGSSARSLKRSGVLMLGGRGSDRRMHVFTDPELATYGYDLTRAMCAGLPRSFALTASRNSVSIGAPRRERPADAGIDVDNPLGEGAVARGYSVKYLRVRVNT